MGEEPRSPGENNSVPMFGLSLRALGFNINILASKFCLVNMSTEALEYTTEKLSTKADLRQNTRCTSISTETD